MLPKGTQCDKLSFAMHVYQWDDEKNASLKETREVCFEQVILHIENGGVLDVIAHPNASKYPHQKVMILNINGYAYAVPFIESGKERFLKTIIPSRKLTKEYLR